jgi:hypothetical protein
MAIREEDMARTSEVKKSILLQLFENKHTGIPMATQEILESLNDVKAGKFVINSLFEKRFIEYGTETIENSKPNIFGEKPARQVISITTDGIEWVEKEFLH